MFDYRDLTSRLHTRGVQFNEKQYLFVAMVCAGEDMRIAYGIVYDESEFHRNVPSEDEETYLDGLKEKAETMLQMQECKQLKEIIDEEIRAEVQKRATDIKEYKFSSQEIVNMLSALLADRSREISDASVRDIVSLIRELASLGGFSGTDGFQSHFIQVLPKFTSLCVSCNKEFDCIAGVDCVCPNCKQVYKWDNDEKRFYPQPNKL